MIDVLGFGVAALPFVVAGVFMLGFGWSAARSGAATLAVAVAGALFWPGFEAGGLGGAVVDGFSTAVAVLYVLFGGLLLYNLLAVGGAIEAVSRFLGELEPEPEGLALVVVIGVSPFFESVTGFGVAVVISAPILLAAGFPPLKAAVLASWGQCAVPWGALGVGTEIGANLSGTSFAALSDWSAILSLPLFPVYGLAAVMLAGGREGIRRRGVEAVLLGLLAGMGTLLTSVFLIPELSGAVGGLAATAAFLTHRRRRFAGLDVPVRALLPYAFLLALLALANGPKPVRALIENQGPAFVGPGLPLLLAAVFAALLFGLGARLVGESIRGTAGQWLPTAGAVITFVLAGEVVADSGAAALLASGVAALGDLYLMAAPFVGSLGGVLTGSNAASNALFMPLQIEAAHSLDLPETLTAAVQNVSGSHASLLAPQRIVLAATATGLLGREGEIARAALPPVAVSVVLLALIVAF